MSEIVEREEWFKRDPVTGNFVHAEPPKQFTPSELTGMLERRANDAAEIERLQALVGRLRETGDELARTVKDVKAGLHQALTKRELSFVADALTQWHRAALTATVDKEG